MSPGYTMHPAASTVSPDAGMSCAMRVMTPSSTMTSPTPQAHLGVGEKGVAAGGGQDDLIPHLEGGEDVGAVGLVVGGEDVLVRTDHQGLVGQEHLGHLQTDGGVDGEVGDQAGLHIGDGLQPHIPAAAVAAGGDGGEVLVEQIDAADFMAGLVKAVGYHRGAGGMVKQGDGHAGDV